MSNQTVSEWQARLESDEKILIDALQRLANPDGAGAQNVIAYGGVRSAVEKLASSLGCGQAVSAGTPVFTDTQSETDTTADWLAQAVRYCEQLNVACRRVKLSGTWHKNNGGPLLAFGNDGTAYALEYGESGYIMWNACSGEYADAGKNADKLHCEALALFRTLPHTELGIRELAVFFKRFYSFRRIVLLLVSIVSGGLLSSVVPAISGSVFGEIVPSANTPLLIIVGVTLVLLAFARTLVFLLRSVTLLNIESVADLECRAAIVERLLGLRTAFFKRFTTGELLARFNDINTVRQTAANAALSVVTSAFMLLVNGFLMFYYGGILALPVLIIYMLYCVLDFAVSWRQMLLYKKQLQADSDYTTRVLQIIDGIDGIKVLRAEKRMFALWADIIDRKLKLGQREYNIGIVASQALVIVQMLSTVTLFVFVSGRAETGNAMPLPMFIGFSAAMAVFFESSGEIVRSLVSILHLIPVYERAQPFFKSIPEKASGGKNVLLKGAVRMENITFGYEPQRPVLKNVSIHAAPGEFVAITGASGSGKSTVLRIILGFEKAETGAVFFDDEETSMLDQKCVRSQCGTVLQTGQLFPGSIYQNIAGSNNYTEDEIWEAAEAACIADDIRSMAMQLHTYIDEGCATISEGQRQRLLIARALVKKPQYIFFDEATSALDNITQAKVMKALRQAKVTRIVIAHRLSTVISADRIYVLDRGAIVETGNYNELMKNGGQFAGLACGQIEAG